MGKIIDTLSAEEYKLKGGETTLNFGEGVLLKKDGATKKLMFSLDDGVFWQEIGSGEIRVEDIQDVEIDNLEEGDVLVYNSALTKWENKKLIDGIVGVQPKGDPISYPDIERIVHIGKTGEMILSDNIESVVFDTPLNPLTMGLNNTIWDVLKNDDGVLIAAIGFSQADPAPLRKYFAISRDNGETWSSDEVVHPTVNLASGEQRTYEIHMAKASDGRFLALIRYGDPYFCLTSSDGIVWEGKPLPEITYTYKNFKELFYNNGSIGQFVAVSNNGGFTGYTTGRYAFIAVDGSYAQIRTDLDSYDTYINSMFNFKTELSDSAPLTIAFTTSQLQLMPHSFGIYEPMMMGWIFGELPSSFIQGNIKSFQIGIKYGHFCSYTADGTIAILRSIEIVNNVIENYEWFETSIAEDGILWVDAKYDFDYDRIVFSGYKNDDSGQPTICLKISSDGGVTWKTIVYPYPWQLPAYSQALYTLMFGDSYGVSLRNNGAGIYLRAPVVTELQNTKNILGIKEIEEKSSGIPIGTISMMTGKTLPNGHLLFGDGQEFPGAHTIFTGENNFADYVMGGTTFGIGFDKENQYIGQSNLATQEQERYILDNFEPFIGGGVSAILQSVTDISLATPSSSLVINLSSFNSSVSQLKVGRCFQVGLIDTSPVPLQLSVDTTIHLYASENGNNFTLQESILISDYTFEELTFTKIPRNAKYISFVATYAPEPGFSLYTTSSISRNVASDSPAALYFTLFNENAQVPLVAMEEWKSQVLSQGFCSSYGVDYVSDTFRMPKLPRFFPSLNPGMIGDNAAYLDQIQRIRMNTGYGDSNPNSVNSITPRTPAIEWRQAYDIAFGFSNLQAHVWNAHVDTAKITKTRTNGYDETSPRNFEVSYIIKAYDAPATPTQVVTDEILTTLTNKADKDLLNTNVDIVVDSSHTSTAWYRKYKSGWIEQGGVIPINTTAVNFSIPYTNYSNVSLSVFHNNQAAGALAMEWSTFTARNVTLAGFEVNATTIYVRSWEAKGY